MRIHTDRNRNSNYAFNPIAEQALGSKQTIVPQRVNAALDIGDEMDSVLVVFPGESVANVRAMAHTLGLTGAAVEADGFHFFVNEYQNAELKQELQPNESSEIAQRFSGLGYAAFDVASSHGQASNLALKFVAELMKVDKSSLLLDDYGNFFTADEVLMASNALNSYGIYELGAWKDTLKTQPNV